MSVRLCALTALSSMALLSLLTISCGGDKSPTQSPRGTPPETPVATTLSLSSSTLSFNSLGASQQLTATVRDQNGVTMPNATVTWESSDQAVATVSSTGLVTSVGNGAATITARSGSVSGTASVAVEPAMLASVEILASSDLLFVGRKTSLTLEARDAAGTLLQGRSVIWASSDPSIAVVSVDGEVTGVGRGRVSISATVEGLSDTTDMLVAELPPQVTVGPWTPIGPTRIPGPVGVVNSGKLQAVAVSEADPSIIYAGGGIGSGTQGPWTEAGVFRTNDGGVTWVPVNSGLTDHAVNALWMNPSDNDVVVVGTERKGIFRTSNGGAGWSQVAAVGATSDFVRASGDLLAATSVGIMRSTDAGMSWNLEYQTSRPVRTLSEGGGVVMAGLQDGTVLRRESSTSPWLVVSTNPGTDVWSIAVDPTNPNVSVMVLFRGALPPAVRRTLDAGATWSTPTGDGVCSPPQALRYEPGSSVLYLGCNPGLQTSTDSGSSWHGEPATASYDIRKVFVLGDGTVVLGTDQGVHLRPPGEFTWNHISSPTHSAILYGVSIRNQTILTSAQDFSPIWSFDGGGTWGHGSPFGEGGQLLIHPQDPQYCYALTTSGFQVSSDGCRTWTRPDRLGIGGVPYSQPGHRDIIAVDPTSPSTVYVATSVDVKRSEDFGRTFNTLPGPFDGSTAVAVNPLDGTNLLVGKRTLSGVYRTTDGGANWTLSEFHSPSPDSLALSAVALGVPSSIAFHPTQPDIVMVALNLTASRGGGVLRSVDGGVTFAAVNNGLAPFSTNVGRVTAPALSFNEAGVVALATPDGVYISRDLGESWEDLTTTVLTDYTDVEWANGYLYATTSGLGLLRATVSGLAFSR